MALGPKLNFINPGDALLASTVMQNFQALANFVRTIPINNLLQPYATAQFSSNYDDTIASAVAPGTSALFGYEQVTLGQAVVPLTVNVMFRGPAGGLAAGDSVVFELQKATPSGSGSRPVFADAWTTIATVTFNNANTVPGTDDINGDSGAFARTTTTISGITADDWIRWKVTVTDSGGAYNVTQAQAQFVAKAYLRP